MPKKKVEKAKPKKRIKKGKLKEVLEKKIKKEQELSEEVGKTGEGAPKEEPKNLENIIQQTPAVSTIPSQPKEEARESPIENQQRDYTPPEKEREGPSSFSSSDQEIPYVEPPQMYIPERIAGELTDAENVLSRKEEFLEPSALEAMRGELAQVGMGEVYDPARPPRDTEHYEPNVEMESLSALERKRHEAVPGLKRDYKELKKR